MLNKDFTKSNKEYFKSNRNILIAIGVFLLVGIIIFAIFGMNGNFELKGYNEFSITVNESYEDKFVKYRGDVGEIINSYDGHFDTMSIYGEGDDTKYVVRYSKSLKDEEISEINKLVAEKLGVDVSRVSAHTHVNPIVKNTDYLYTTAAILLLIVIATIFSYARYNGASSITMLLACLLGTLGYMAIGTLLRIVVGMSYLAMLVILNMLIVYVTISLFESMHKSSWLTARDFGSAIKSAIKESKFRLTLLSIALMLIGVMFVLIAPSPIKYISLNVMFMAVILLAVALYVVPFVWSVFITRTKLRDYKVKTSNVETKEEK